MALMTVGKHFMVNPPENPLLKKWLYIFMKLCTCAPRSTAADIL
jgi:hypothetical protein